MWSSVTGKMEVRHLPTEEQRWNLLEEIYANYEEVNAQQKEIARRKREMGSEIPDGNWKKISRVLFSENPSDVARFGDWDTYERIEQTLKKFVYSRSQNAFAGNTKEDALSERIDILSDIRAQQADRIASLETTLAATQEELAGLMDMLRMKDREIKKVKRVFLVKQLNNSQRQREREAADEASMQQRQSIYDDMNVLIEVNKAIERENTRLRTALEAKEFLGGADSRASAVARSRESEQAAGGQQRECRAGSSVYDGRQKESRDGASFVSQSQVNPQGQDVEAVAATGPSPPRGKEEKASEAAHAGDSVVHYDHAKTTAGARRPSDAPSFSAGGTTDAEQLRETDARKRYIQQQAPVTSVLMRLHKERMMWQRRLEAEAANTMALLDSDAYAARAVSSDPRKESVDLSAARLARFGSQASRPFGSSIHFQLSTENIESHRRESMRSFSRRYTATSETESLPQSEGNVSTVSSECRTARESASGEGTVGSEGESRASLPTSIKRKKEVKGRRRTSRKSERAAKLEKRKVHNADVRPSWSLVRASISNPSQSHGVGSQRSESAGSISNESRQEKHLVSRRSTMEGRSSVQKAKTKDAALSPKRPVSNSTKVKAVEGPDIGSTVGASSASKVSRHRRQEKKDASKEQEPRRSRRVVAVGGQQEALHALKVEMGAVRDKHKGLRTEMDEFFLVLKECLTVLRGRNEQLEHGVEAESQAFVSEMAEDVIKDMVEQRVFDRLEQQGIVLQRHPGPSSALTDEEWAQNQFYDAILKTSRERIAGALVKGNEKRGQKWEAQQGARPPWPPSQPPPLPNPSSPRRVAALLKDAATPSAGKTASSCLPRPPSNSNDFTFEEPTGGLWPVVTPLRPPPRGGGVEEEKEIAGTPTSTGYEPPLAQLRDWLHPMAGGDGGFRGEYEKATGPDPWASPPSAAFPYGKEGQAPMPPRGPRLLPVNIVNFSTPLGQAGLRGYAGLGQETLPPPKRFEGNILAYLRSLQPREHAGGVENMAPAVYRYDFKAALAEARMQFQGTVRAAAAQMRKPFFENAFRNEILPYAKAAKSLQNGQRMAPWMLAAVRQLRAEEEQRNRRKRHHLFERIATNLRARHLLKSHVCRGSAMASYVIVLWERWLDRWKKKSAVQRVEKEADLNRMLDLIAANLKGRSRPPQREAGAGNLKDAKNALLDPSSSHFSEVRFPPKST
ncbi:uncharacterized protein Tco025E_06648 [Trypanosoma conorhini]|uniref:Uncharacterized protein n=1 Tax=Trypanosoma conorhini TaxID=83891 RepID=A0A3R7KX79_9TRYP|nr:uncharacterized protein Tco025E_06648 [Trypanosoma conorhini]RNF11503.1 hypothetical protein Tco025E_06648 [Trypanosoma conorhini]